MVRDVLKIQSERTDSAFRSLNIELTDYEFDGLRMGMPTLTATLEYPRPLDDDWTGQEYVVMRGERYYITQPASSQYDSQKCVYTHSLEFRSEREILQNVYYYDTVSDVSQTNDKPVSNSTTVVFFGTIAQFVDRLNCSFLEAGIADSILKTKTTLTTSDKPVGDGYCAVVDYSGGYDYAESHEFSFENRKIWEAMSDGYEITKIPFEFHGKQIVWGAKARVVNHVLRKGAGNELLSIKRNNANAAIINRITFKGGTTNIPHYYPNESEYGHIALKYSAGNANLNGGIEIYNQTLLLAYARENTPIVLHRQDNYAQAGQATIEHWEYSSVSSSFSSYTLGQWIQAQRSSEDQTTRVRFRATVRFDKDGDYKISDVWGQMYWSFLGDAKEDERSIWGAIDDISLNLNAQTITPVHTANGDVFKGLKANTDYTINLWLTFSQDRDINEQGAWYCFVSGVGISYVYAETEVSTKTYWWQCGDVRKNYLADFGLRYTGGDEFEEIDVGDSLYWIGEDRIPFQTNLMPPLYSRAVIQGVGVAGVKRGEERFYNAVNNRYRDEDGNFIHFPNPFVAGHPNEHIHTNEDIYPTIKGVTNANGDLLGEIIGIAFDDNDNDSKRPDNDDSNLTYEHSFFYVKLHVFNGEHGFNLFDCVAQEDAMTMQMTSGPCNGCKFKIQATKFDGVNGGYYYRNPVQTDKANGNIVGGGYEQKVNKANLQEWQQDTSKYEVWIAVQKEDQTFGVVMPNATNNYRPQIGDTFNLTGIRLPQGYIDAAEDRGEKEMLEYMAQNNEPKYTYEVGLSRVYFAYHKDFLAELDEYCKVKFEYNGKIIEQFIDTFKIVCRNGEVLPDIQMTFADELTVGQSYAQQIAEKLVNIIGTTTASGGGSAQPIIDAITQAIADTLYLSKTRDDRSTGSIATDKGIEVGQYAAGAKGGIFNIDPQTGQSYLEADVIRARARAIFSEVVVAKASAIGGKLVLTPGGAIKITFVAPSTNRAGEVTAYKCYYKRDEDSGDDGCYFKMGDLAFCQELGDVDISGAVQTRRYWRSVVTVNKNEGYVELSSSQCEEGSDIPQVGDTICQLGYSGSDAFKERQNAIIISTTDNNSPNITFYNEIYTFSLADRKIIELGFDSITLYPYIHCYGSMFFGPKGDNPSTFIRYTPETGVQICGDISLKSTFDGESLNEAIKVGGDNLIRNANFAEPSPTNSRSPRFWKLTNNWNVSDITFNEQKTLQCVVQGLSTNGFQMAYQSHVADGNIDADNINELLTGTLGDVFTLSVYAMTNANGVAIDQGAYMEVAFLDGNGDRVSSMQQSIVPIRTNQWQRFKMEFTFPKGANSFRVNFYLVRNGSINIACPQLEKGNVLTDWRLSSHDMATNAGLKAVGIDINKEEVLVTGQFRTQNRLGETTAIVDEDGMLTTSLIRTNEIQTHTVVCYDDAGNIISTVNREGDGAFIIYYKGGNLAKKLRLCDDEETNSVIQYFNEDGSIAWTLGASGQITLPEGNYIISPVNLFYGTEAQARQAGQLTPNVTFYIISSVSEADFLYNLTLGSDTIQKYKDLNGRYVRTEYSSPNDLFARTNFVTNAQSQNGYAYYDIAAVAPTINSQTGNKTYYRKRLTFNAEAKATIDFITWVEYQIQG